MKNKNYYELLHFILPRYIRISELSLNYQKILLIKIKERFCLNLSFIILWIPNFIILPGYIPISEINKLLQELEQQQQQQQQEQKEEEVFFHIFPIDIASAIPSYILSKLKSKRYLDLCCSPGGKLISLTDWLFYHQYSSNFQENSNDNNSVISIGVDISNKRLEICRSLVHSYYQYLYRLNHNNNDNNNNLEYPRIMLFCGDGTLFGSSLNNIGTLMYDSSVDLEEISHTQINGRKRQNKSSRGRLKKKLKQIQTSIQNIINIDNNNNSNNNTNEELKNEQYENNTDLNLINFNEFDVVLVDAQCTHDGSYRHLRYISNDTSVEQLNEFQNKIHEFNNESKTENSTDLKFSTIHKSHSSLLGSLFITNEYKNNESKLEENKIREEQQEQEQELQLGAEELKQLQRGLILNGFNRLKRGGRMIYSTCSFHIEQNEQIVQWLLDEINNNNNNNNNNNLSSVTTLTTTSSIITTSLMECTNSFSAKIVPLNEWYITNETNIVDETFHPMIQTILSSSDEVLFHELSLIFQNNPNDLKLISNDMCRYISSLSSPPGKQGAIPGTVYYGRWSGTSGLFMACIEKI